MNEHFLITNFSKTNVYYAVNNLRNIQYTTNTVLEKKKCGLETLQILIIEIFSKWLHFSYTGSTCLLTYFHVS